MAHRTIILKGLPEREEGEVKSGSTIWPGDHVVVEPDVLATDPAAPDLYDVGAAGNEQARTIALENDLMGDGVGDAYLGGGHRLQVATFAPGMEAAVRAGGTVTKGDALEAADAGTFITASSGTPVAVALEAGTNGNLMHVRFV